MADEEPETRPARGESTRGPATTDVTPRHAPPDKVLKPDVRNGVALATAAIVFAFTVLSGFAIHAAASFDGGQPGTTAPADPIHEYQDPPAAPRVLEPGEHTDLGLAPAATQPRADTDAIRTAPPAGHRSRLPAGPTADRLAGTPFPMDCEDAGTTITNVLTDPGGPTVVQVTCAAGSGSPPGALYAYATDDGDTPRLVATLLTADPDRLVRDVTRDGATITAHTLGWSDPQGPRCCPDTTEVLRWHVDFTGATRL